MKKVGRIVINCISILLMVFAVAIILPRLFGIQAFGVLSGSMEPEMPVGSLIYAVPTDQEKILVNDPITYVMESGAVVTHRVVKIDPETGYFTVKGDANDTPDANPVRYENVVGVVKVHVPIVGFAVGFASTTQGKIVVITLIIVLLLLMVLLKDDDEELARNTTQRMPVAKVPAPIPNIPRRSIPTANVAVPQLGARVYDRSRRYIPRHPAA